MADPNAIIVYNHDIVGIVGRLDRFVMEIVKSVSSDVTMMTDFDQKRLASYINAVRIYQAWVEATPSLDLPESHPTQYLIPNLPAAVLTENESVGDVARLLNLARIELVNSQSARLPSGLIKYDSARFKAVIDKVEAFLTGYIKNADPLDLPESSPEAPMTGTGRIGV